MTEVGQVTFGPREPPGLEDFAYGSLFRRRILFLKGAIRDEVADDVAAQMLALGAQNPRPITLYIDSPGGELSGLFTIHDTMLMLDARVNTVCLGIAASAAAVVLATGTGTRAATPNARIMLHQPHGGATGTAKDIEIQAREIAFLRGRLEQILAERTGQPLERIRADTDRDFWLSAEEARGYGLIDEVLAAARVG